MQQEHPAKTGNSFVSKILISNSISLNILRTLFANPASVKAFHGRGGGGNTSNPRCFPKSNFDRRAHLGSSQDFFARDFHSISIHSVIPSA
jgi:uncharacterized protein (DUF779 family)